MTMDGGDDEEDTDTEKTSNNVAYSPVATPYLTTDRSGANPERFRLVVFKNDNISKLSRMQISGPNPEWVD